MNYKNILKGYSLEEKEIVIEGEEIPILLATLKYIKNMIAKYYILDFLNSEKLNNCEQKLRDTKYFEYFERTILERDYFNEPGDSRFNLYLVFVVSDDSYFLYNSYIRNDFKYARKIILTKTEFKDFFENISIKQENNPYFPRNIEQKEVVNKLKIMAKESLDILQNETAINVYSKKGLFNKIVKKQTYYKNIINEDFIKCMGLYRDFEKNILDYNKETENIEKYLPNNYRIKYINELLIDNYRAQKGRKRIPFGRVNLLLGENGVGKTTILDAIELGLTGVNKNTIYNNLKDGYIKVDCINQNGKEVSFSSDKNYISLSSDWYGIKADNREYFNKMFNQYNYFDTGFASKFAIEGKKQTNYSQLQEFLGIYNVQRCEELLKELYESLKIICQQNIDLLEKKKSHTLIEIRMKANVKNKFLSKLSMENIERCNIGLEKLEEDIKIISLEEILDAHIKKIEGIFKLLVASNEFAELKVEDDEIVAIRSASEESVSVVQMSTGQKVCLALAFMFDLFLSNSNTPNIIMLDEPAANLDDLHMLNLLDVLRKIALSGTQIFFTTNNPTVAKLFRRKFSFLENDFRYFNIVENNKKHEISCKYYSPTHEEPIEIVNIINNKNNHDK